jgi:quinol monooxygenase YgiN
MVVVAGTAQLQPGTFGQAQTLIEEVVRLTRSEPGCISYTFYSTVGDPDTIHVFEEWESGEALNAHLQQKHTQDFLAAIGAHLAGPPDIKRYEVSSISSLF